MRLCDPADPTTDPRVATRWPFAVVRSGLVLPGPHSFVAARGDDGWAVERTGPPARIAAGSGRTHRFRVWSAVAGPTNPDDPQPPSHPAHRTDRA
ncbi:hypothetical protein DKM19_17390 [Streptosporangium sp. 'caverna']|nr:hypothetical protein DKM19_17390 [Streptosporangium sp. 'caverna']